MHPEIVDYPQECSAVRNEHSLFSEKGSDSSLDVACINVAEG